MDTVYALCVRSWARCGPRSEMGFRRSSVESLRPDQRLARKTALRVPPPKGGFAAFRPDLRPHGPINACQRSVTNASTSDRGCPADPTTLSVTRCEPLALHDRLNITRRADDVAAYRFTVRTYAPST
jgi:hypothetical protein